MRPDKPAETMKDVIFSPLRVGPITLKNRLVALPVYTGYAHPGGRVSALLMDHYTRLADSGVAMVVVANAAVAPDGIGSTYNLRVDHDAFLPGLTELAGAIRKRGAVACLQLNHTGRFAKTEQPLLPSPADSENLAFNITALKDFMNFFPFEKRFGLTHYFLRLFSTWRRAMTLEDSQKVVRQFGDAAFRAFQAGFDMIELHGANGYLLCQFLSAFTNKETSMTGGEFENRTAIPLSVIREVKKRLPADFPVGFRLILEEWVPGGIDLQEALTLAGKLQDEGIAYLSAAAGTYSSIFSSQALKKMSRPAYLRNEVSRLTSEVTIPTIISGRIIKPSLARTLIDEGVADLIGLGRPLLVDFDWVKKVKEGREKEITHCINCNNCLKRVILDQGFNCVQWPRPLQESIDLDQKLLSRMYKDIWVASGIDDLELFKSALPLFVPEKRRVTLPIPLTLLFLEGTGESPLSPTEKKDFLMWSKGTLQQLGYVDPHIDVMDSVVKDTAEKAVNDAIERGHHGVIFLGKNRNQAWRERLLYKVRGKVMALIGSSPHQSNILVPVDLSTSTLLALKFIGYTYAGKGGLNLDFVHVLTGSPAPVKKRWEELKGIAGWDDDLRLHMVPERGDIADSLLEFVKEGDYGTIIMGKRGLSGIKRRLLGSVSASLLHGLSNQTLFLVD